MKTKITKLSGQSNKETCICSVTVETLGLDPDLSLV